MKKKLVFGFILSLVLTSCSGDEEFTNPNQSQNQLREQMEFKYKGVIYSSNYYLVNDSIVFDDKDVQQLYSNLNSSSELVSYQFENEILEFFEDNKEFEQYLNNKYSESINTRAITIPQYINGNITLYEDKSYKGKNFSYNFNNKNSNGTWETVWEISDFRSMSVQTPLLPVNFNDQLTSFKASLSNSQGVILHVRIYENCFFKGKSKIFETRNPSISVNTLYEYNMKGRKSWDDETSSMAVKLLVPPINI